MPEEEGKGLIIVITDQEELGEDVFDKEITNPYIVLQFAENVENDLAFFSKISGGFPLKLFRSSPNLVEKEEFLKKLNSLSTKIVSNGESEIKDVLPKISLPQMHSDSFFFVGRTIGASENKNVSAGHFVSRRWGGLKIAEILKSLSSFYRLKKTEDASLLSISPRQMGGRRDQLDALLAIGRTFGISTEFFNDKTTRVELEEKLNLVSKIELLKEILKLNTTPSNSSSSGENVRFLNGVPLYKIKKRDFSVEPAFGFNRGVGMTKEKGEENVVWQQFNFPELVRAETHIKIAPFSEAQKELFVKFPEFVAEGFGMAEEVNFCTEFRCISVLREEREETKPSDRAFFKDYDAGHWAHGYIVRAVEEGLFEPELNGKLHPNRPIDRGEFSQMVVKAFELNSSSNPGSKFTDVYDPEYFDAVQILAERGIVKGYPDGTFRPLQSLTRAEGVKILLSVLDFQPGLESNEFLDTYSDLKFSDVMGWEKPWVAEAVQRGMVCGYDDGTFRPHGKLTRAEALKLVFEIKH